jgi:hypothetical protein
LVGALRAQGVRDRRVIDAFRAVPRARFVPPESAGVAYADEPIPIPHGQVTTQPSLIASMVEALRLGGGERVLEVGTGLGFQTAILALLAGRVVSVERFADLAAQARANLAAVGLDRVTVLVGDGTLGVVEYAPTRRSWSRPRRRASRCRWSGSSPRGVGWCTRSGRADARSSRCSASTATVWSPTPSSPWPASSPSWAAKPEACEGVRASSWGAACPLARSFVYGPL